MDSTKFCSMPCVGGKSFCIPEPSATKPSDFKFYEDGDRALYMVMIGNTQTNQRPKPEHKVAIVGLSPADTQLRQFSEKYNRTRSYEDSALEAAFEGLEKDLVRMMNGLGVTKKLGLERLPDTIDLNRCGHFLTTSLIKCASLTLNGCSSDFDLWKYQSNVRCVTERFIPEIISSESISHILILGNKAKKALTEKIRIDGISVHEYLEEWGKKIAYLPHPSGANRESVDLASLDSKDFPTMEQHQDRMWSKYQRKRLQEGNKVEDESSYKRTRGSRWKAIHEIRQIFNA